MMKSKLLPALILAFVLFGCSTAEVKKESSEETASFTEKSTFKWTAGAPLIAPKPEKNRPTVSVKDPSVLFYKDKWHVFYTTCDEKGVWSMEFVNFKEWKDADKAKRFNKDDNPNLTGYHCAPNVFYFTPHKKWYMVFQSGQPQYSTNDDINNPMGWTKPVDFFDGAPPGLEKGQWGPEWLDFHCIADDKHVYLFFTGDNGRFYRSRTSIENFPKGMSNPVTVLKDDEKGKIFEGSITYKIKGQKKYLTLIEAFGAPTWDRYYRSFIADSLDGEWREQAASWEKPFAGLTNVTFEKEVEPWTKDISHGELIRAGYDEKMEIDTDNLQFIFQGRDPVSNGMAYHLLPYKIGMLTKAKE